MLIGNYSVINKSPGKFRAGTSVCDRSAYNMPGMSRGMFFGDRSVYVNGSGLYISSHLLSTYGIPLGEVPPYSWIIPQVAGGMAMRTDGSSSISFTLIPQQPTSASLTGTGDLTASASLLIAMICAITAGGSLTASISGDGNITASMTGTGDLNADIIAFGNMIADLTGTGLLSADVHAIADMSIDIVVTGTGLSTENVGKYVWEALVAEFSSDPGSAAAKLLAAGGAGDPWSTSLPASYTGDQAGALLLAYLKKIKAISSANL